MSRLGPVLLTAVLIAAAAPFAQQSPVFRADVQTIPIYATVLGPDGQLVADLRQADFEVFDNGRPQAVTLFDAGVQPISIVVMLDMSGSMLGNISVLRSAAVQMFTRLLPADQARVGNFGDRIVISPHFTNDVDELTRALWLDLQPGGPTPLWGAVNAAMTALAHVSGRRVVLVLTDGKNTGLRSVNGIAVGPSLKEMIERAETEDFMVYAIGMRSKGGQVTRGARGGPGGGRGAGGPGRRATPQMSGRAGESDDPDPGLREIASDSGGGYFPLDGTENLGSVFAAVADQLHRQYLLGCLAPEIDGKVHRVDVRVTRPSMAVRARQSYLAPRKPMS